MAAALADRYPWFESVREADLQQGDLLAACPIFRPASGQPIGDSPMPITVNYVAGIIMTRSCDLAVRADGKCHCKEVLFCPIYSRGELANDAVFGRKQAWEDARKGRLPGYHVLNRCDLPGREREFTLVDFSRVFTVDVVMVRDSRPSRNRGCDSFLRTANIWRRRSRASSCESDCRWTFRRFADDGTSTTHDHEDHPDY